MELIQDSVGVEEWRTAESTYCNYPKYPSINILAPWGFIPLSIHLSVKWTFSTPLPFRLPLIYLVWPKGVGPGPTLAWAGWRQPDIPVEVDTDRLETSRFKKCFANCVLLYFPSTEFKSDFNVYWHGGGAAGLSCTELFIWEFPFLRGTSRQGWNSIWYCVKEMPQKDTLDDVAYTCVLVSYHRHSPQFQFSLSAVTL